MRFWAVLSLDWDAIFISDLDVGGPLCRAGVGPVLSLFSFEIQTVSTKVVQAQIFFVLSE